MARTRSTWAPHLPVPVDDALGRAGGTGGEDAPRSRRRRPGSAGGLPPGRGRQVGEVVAAPRAPCGPPAPAPGRRCGCRAAPSPVPRPGRGGRPRRGPSARTAQGPSHAGEAEPLVGDHHDGARAPHGVDDRGEVGRGLDEERDPVAGTDAGRGQSGGELGDPPARVAASSPRPRRPRRPPGESSSARAASGRPGPRRRLGATAPPGAEAAPPGASRSGTHAATASAYCGASSVTRWEAPS